VTSSQEDILEESIYYLQEFGLPKKDINSLEEHLGTWKDGKLVRIPTIRDVLMHTRAYYEQLTNWGPRTTDKLMHALAGAGFK
jgi:hypothetical protein